MKKISIIALSVLLAACSSGTYTTDVTSESHRVEYEPQLVEASTTKDVMAEETVQDVRQPVAAKQVVSVPTQQTQQVASSKKVKILPPEAKHKQMVQRFGYTLQVVAVDSPEKARLFAQQLPEGQPVWEHYKQVKGTDWYALLYGDFETKSEAKASIATLPTTFKQLKPFVKSLDDIKNSNFPELNQLRK